MPIKILFWIIDHVMPVVSPVSFMVLCRIITDICLAFPENTQRYTLDELATKIGVKSPRTVRRAIDELVSKGYIKECNDYVDVYAIEVHLRNKNTSSTHVGHGHLVCEWCNCRTFVLDHHHFPVPARLCGTLVVNICRNCHAEFHYLVDRIRYELDSKMLVVMNEHNTKGLNNEYN
jgi:DNA-binding MarR family transcriptional regulator